MDQRVVPVGVRQAVPWGSAALSLTAACVLGVFGAFFTGRTNWALAVAIPLGAALLVGYSLELFGGRLHNDATFAWAWGGFPVAVGFVAQDPDLSWTALFAAVAATLAGVGTSYAQRRLSTPARELRRRTAEVSGTLTRTDGNVTPLDSAALLAPLEGALRALSWAVPVVAAAALFARF